VIIICSAINAGQNGVLFQRKTHHSWSKRGHNLQSNGRLIEAIDCFAAAGFPMFGFKPSVLNQYSVGFSKLRNENPDFSGCGARFTTRKLLFVVLIFGLVYGTVGWCFREGARARWKARGSDCRSNLHYIGMALRNYHEIYRSFPRAYTVDKNGKPSCSWRVLLLAADPAYSHIYNAYNFDDTWDGPSNRRLASQVPSLYSCPNDLAQQGASLFTSYVAVVGPGTAFEGNMSIETAEVQHGRNQTILIAEVANSGINWMEPRDLDVRRMSFLLNDPALPSISSRDPGGPGVICNDGRVDRLDSGMTRDALKAMSIIAGGETIDESR
jgi:hypothetical protein